MGCMMGDESKDEGEHEETNGSGDDVEYPQGSKLCW